MQFYTYAFIENQAHINNLFSYSISFIFLVVLLIVGIKYFRNRFLTKYRDLSIILLLLIVFSLGIHWDDYSKDQHYVEETSHMAGFINAFSTNMNVDKEQVMVNSLNLKNGMIVKVDENFYEIEFNPDYNAYEYKQIFLVNDKITITDLDKK